MTINSFPWPKFVNTLRLILQSSKVFYGKQITFYDKQMNTQSMVVQFEQKPSLSLTVSISKAKIAADETKM